MRNRLRMRPARRAAGAATFGRILASLAHAALAPNAFVTFEDPGTHSISSCGMLARPPRAGRAGGLHLVCLSHLTCSFRIYSTVSGRQVKACNQLILNSTCLHCVLSTVSMQ
jgi:hypothetical protein